MDGTGTPQYDVRKEPQLDNRSFSIRQRASIPVKSVGLDMLFHRSSM